MAITLTLIGALARMAQLKLNTHQGLSVAGTC